MKLEDSKYIVIVEEIDSKKGFIVSDSQFSIKCKFG
jgi:hypothetical protein